MEDLVKQYNERGSKYTEARNRFYSDKEDKTRKAFYSQFDFPLEGRVLLDAGCGFGKDMAHFQSLGAIVHGIDNSKEMIRLSKENFPELKNLSVQSFEKTNFPDNFFDVIYSRYALHYSRNLDKVYEEFNRILKSGGHLIFLVAHPLFAFAVKKDKDYYKMQITEFPIFDGNFVLRAPSHTFTDYISPYLLENFELLNFEEQPSKDRHRECKLKEVIPLYIMMKLRKR